MSEPLGIHFEELEIGQVIALGVCVVDEQGLQMFAERFLPDWDTDNGAPDAMIYALWNRLSGETTRRWTGFKMLAVDGIRYMRNPPPGEMIRGRMTVMGKDPVGDTKGVVIIQQDLLDEAGRLVFSCLTRALVARR